MKRYGSDSFIFAILAAYLKVKVPYDDRHFRDFWENDMYTKVVNVVFPKISKRMIVVGYLNFELSDAAKIAKMNESDLYLFKNFENFEIGSSRMFFRAQESW